MSKLLIQNILIPVEKDGIPEYLKAAALRLKTGIEGVKLLRILAKTSNFSDPGQFYYMLSLAVEVSTPFDTTENFPFYDEAVIQIKPQIRSIERPLIIGFGPAGMFAALELLECGLKPIVLERGKKLEERSLDIKTFMDKRVLDQESNIQFGEGGAGSYSDGKLFTRISNSPAATKVMETLIRYGAPEEIRYVDRPHIGTDVLCKVVKKIREFILENGGEILFNSKMTDLLIKDGKVRGVVVNGSKEYLSSKVFLAIGHSARDTFVLLERKGVSLEQKPVAVGIRIEHPVGVINLMRYGEKYKDFKPLGAATYSLNYSNEKTGRRLNTFCMCPGGEVVNASSEQGLLVVNGMSYSARASAYSNTAFIITCNTSDYTSPSPLAGIEFQRKIEKNAYIAGGSDFRVPAQNLLDFISGKHSAKLNKSSCRTGTKETDLNSVLPGFVCETLKGAFQSWKKDYPEYVSEAGLLLAPETRTSCAVKILRNDDFQSAIISGLYPIGEGSGYAGGIMSSASDGIKAVEKAVTS